MSLLDKYHTKDRLEAGIDEAGRGPLFGRVYIGVAILPQDDSFNHSLMRDSKKLTERKRLIAYDYIKDFAIDYTTFYHDEKTIDNINIFKATFDAMHRGLDKLLVRPEHLLIDGNYFPLYSYKGDFIPFTCVTKGDDTYTPIAAASILAKVERDKYIEKLCLENEELDTLYSLKSNKGYGTKKHLDGIRENGITQWHRRTFGICKQFQ